MLRGQGSLVPRLHEQSGNETCSGARSPNAPSLDLPLVCVMNIALVTPVISDRNLILDYSQRAVCKEDGPVGDNLDVSLVINVIATYRAASTLCKLLAI